MGAKFNADKRARQLASAVDLAQGLQKAAMIDCGAAKSVACSHRDGS
jgi:hypothetical protein